MPWPLLHFSNNPGDVQTEAIRATQHLVVSGAERKTIELFIHGKMLSSVTRTKRSLKVQANLLFPMKLLQKAAESIVLHCQEGKAVPPVPPPPRQGPNLQHCTWPWGLSSLCHRRRAASHTKHPGGLSALYLCSLKCLCCPTLTGTKERSSSPVSGSHVTGTALHWEHSRDTGLAGGIYGGATEEPPKPRRSQVSLPWHARGSEPGLHRCCWKLGTGHLGCEWKKRVYFLTLP